MLRHNAISMVKFGTRCLLWNTIAHINNATSNRGNFLRTFSHAVKISRLHPRSQEPHYNTVRIERGAAASETSDKRERMNLINLIYEQKLQVYNLVECQLKCNYDSDNENKAFAMRHDDVYNFISVHKSYIGTF